MQISFRERLITTSCVPYLSLGLLRARVPVQFYTVNNTNIDARSNEPRPTKHYFSPPLLFVSRKGKHLTRLSRDPLSVYLTI